MMWSDELLKAWCWPFPPMGGASEDDNSDSTDNSGDTSSTDVGSGDSATTDSGMGGGIQDFEGGGIGTGEQGYFDPGGAGYQGDQTPGLPPAEYTITPPGLDAPIDQFNFSAPSPLEPIQAYPPGTPAPPEEFQISSPVNQAPSPASYALSSLLFGGNAGVGANNPATAAATWDALDEATKDTFRGVYGSEDAARAGWEKENAANEAAAMAGPTKQFEPNQQYVQRNANGTFTTVVGGKAIYNGPSQQQAEQAYNKAMGNANAPLAAPAVKTAVAPPVKAPVAPEVTGLNARMKALEDAQVASNQQSARNATLPTLTNILASKFGAGALNSINGLLTQMGLPPLDTMGQQGANGLQPNGISPAQWDALPDSMKAIILQAWGAMGGNTVDFQNGINNQRPSGTAPQRGSTRTLFAPLR